MKKSKPKEAKMTVATKTRQMKAAPASRKQPAATANGIHTSNGSAPGTTRIIVVDDHPLFRHGLVQLLDSEAGLSVCGEASSGPEALDLVRALKPTMLIVDLGLKGPSGIE